MILNFGMAGTHSPVQYSFGPLTSSFHTAGFQPIDLAHLQFPAKMYVDYIRVYQRADTPGIGCSPDEYPTEDYINKYENLTFCFGCGGLIRN